MQRVGTAATFFLRVGASCFGFLNSAMPTNHLEAGEVADSVLCLCRKIGKAEAMGSGGSRERWGFEREGRCCDPSARLDFTRAMPLVPFPFSVSHVREDVQISNRACNHFLSRGSPWTPPVCSTGSCRVPCCDFCSEGFRLPGRSWLHRSRAGCSAAKLLARQAVHPFARPPPLPRGWRTRRLSRASTCILSCFKSPTTSICSGILVFQG